MTNLCLQLSHDNGNKNDNDDSQHQLLGRKLKERGQCGETLFEAYISSETVPYLLDHQIKGIKLFPAAAYIDIFLCVLTHYQKSLQLTDIRFVRPLLLDNAITIQTRILSSDNQLTIEIWAKKKESTFWKMVAIACALSHKQPASKQTLFTADSSPQSQPAPILRLGQCSRF